MRKVFAMDGRQHSKHPQPEREAHEKNTPLTMGQPIQHSASTGQLPLYMQAMGSEVFPSLHLPNSRQAVEEQPLRRREEPISNSLSELLQRRRQGKAHLPPYTHLWGHQPPPWLRIGTTQQTPDEQV